MTTLTPTLVFPHPTLTPLTDKPSERSIRLLKREVFANAIAIHSTRGGGAHGHLFLVVPQAEYNNMGLPLFVQPVHPGPNPVHGDAPTAAQITETNRQYTQNLTEFTLYRTATQEIKRQLLDAIPATYIDSLSDSLWGFTNVSPANILEHLTNTYGDVTPTDLEDNRNQLQAPWNIDEPIENIWTRTDQILDYATRNGEPIPNGTTIRLLIVVFTKTGLFTNAIDLWNRKPAADKTLPNFKAHFNFENKDRLDKLTAARAGFHGANTATIPVPERANAATPAPPQVLADGTTRLYYCWTHGLGPSSAHTSLTCTTTAVGHVREATAAKPCGGCMTFRPPGTLRRQRQPRVTAPPTPQG
jgi:hypothetical protein